MQYGLNEGRQISEHFNSNEFRCDCGVCRIILVNTDLVSKLEEMRKILGSSLTISSGYRCEHKQHELTIRGFDTAKGISQHTLGNAVDVTNGVTPGFELEDAARKAGFKAVGVAKTWVHVDLRSDRDRRWTYKS
jgi:uncharacterized protein YcbK (DUF882 family)